MAFNNNSYVDLLLKKYLGVPETSTSNSFAQEAAGVARPSVFSNSQLFSQYISPKAPAPDDLIIDGYIDINGGTGGTSGSNYGILYKSKTYPWIQYVKNLKLSPVVSGLSYRFANPAIATNLLSNSIPFNYDPVNASYKHVLNTSSGTYYGSSLVDQKYYLIDVDAGYLIFINNDWPTSITPVISFYRYNGTIGIPTNIGSFAGAYNQGPNALAYGNYAGYTGQGTGSIAIGTNAGQYGQGTGSIAIGYLAGPTGMSSNSIALNASGTGLYATGPTGGFFVSPVASYSGSQGPFTLLAYGADKQIVTVTGATGLNLSLSTPTVTYDSWLLTNLIGAPPVPVLSVTNTTNDIYITFTYPIQTICGYFTSPLPLLSSFNVNLYTGINPYISQDGSKVDMASASEKFIKSSTNTSPILCIHLTNTSITEGYKSGGTYGPEYVISVPSINTTGLITSSTGKLWAWYNNNSTSNNISNILFNYLQSVAAAVITNLSFTIGATANTYSITLSFKSPSSSGVTSNNLTYNITFTPSTNSIRYNTVYNTTPVTLTATSTSLSTDVTTNTSSGLFPDTIYNVSVTSTNASNLVSTAVTTTTTATIGYSPTSYFITTLANNPVLSLALSSTYSALLVNNSVATTTTYTVISSTCSIIATITMNVQNCYANRGKTGDGATAGSTNKLLNAVNAILSGPITQTSNSISVGGWGQTNTTTGTANANITISANTIVDAFKDEFSGYYQKCPFTVTVVNNTTNFPDAPTISTAYALTFGGTYPATNTVGGTAYTFSITPSSNYPFYWDGKLAIPTATTPTFTINSSGNTLTAVCGLYVYSGDLSLSVTTTAIKNVGIYFINSTNLLTYSSSFGGTMPAETSKQNVTSGIASGKIDNTNGLTITNTLVAITGISQTSYQSSLTITSTAYNIAGTYGGATSNPTLLIYDPSSVTLLNTYTTSSVFRVPSTSTAGNEAVSGYNSAANSGTPNNTPANILLDGTTLYSSAIYDHTKKINSTNLNYSKDALLYNGNYYGSGSGFTTYTLYNGISGTIGTSANVDYTAATINTGISVRYVTLAFPISSTVTPFNTITFTINNLKNVIFDNTTSSLYYGTTTTNRFLFFYRMEDSTNTTTATNWTAGGQISTPWIDGNYVASNASLLTNPSLPTASNIGNRYFTPCGGTTLSGYNSTTSTGTFVVKLPYIINSTTATTSTKTFLYCRIGINTAYAATTFNNVSYNTSSS